MHKTLEEIRESLESLATSIDETIETEESFGISAKNWAFPGINKFELIEQISDVIEKIDIHGGESLGDNSELLAEYPERISYLEESLIPNIEGNFYQGVSTITLTLHALERALSTAFKSDPLKEVTSAIRSLQSRVRGREAQISDLQPRIEQIDGMVTRISEAYESADRLPTDLESLGEARKKIGSLADASSTDRATISSLLQAVQDSKKNIEASEKGAADVLAKCESAYRAATSVGLAAAFAERSKALAFSMWAWVVGLMAALGIAGWLGHNRIEELGKVISSATSTTLIIINILSSVLAVGAPIWFAWLATKQIGQRFRLSEDYAFKASVSRAYEGYRREAANIDQDLEIKLLASALTRIDELPLRLVDPDNHGSPAHELLSSEPIKQAMKSIPGFVDRVKLLAERSIDQHRNGRAAGDNKKGSSANPTSADSEVGDEE